MSAASVSFEALRVGDELPSFATPSITRHQLALYCGGSGDHNPVHVDSDFAKAAGMPDVIAHGMLSMGFMARLLARWVPQSAVKSFGVRFQAITWVGDRISVSGRVVEVDADRRRVRVEMQCVNQKAETTLRGEALIAFE